MWPSSDGVCHLNGAHHLYCSGACCLKQCYPLLALKSRNASLVLALRSGLPLLCGLAPMVCAASTGLTIFIAAVLVASSNASRCAAVLVASSNAFHRL